MRQKCRSRYSPRSPPSRAAWIEIVKGISLQVKGKSRRLHGRRGLKCGYVYHEDGTGMSPPSRAAWIEITSDTVACERSLTSPPSRAAWIEMIYSFGKKVLSSVAAFTGGVD